MLGWRPLVAVGRRSYGLYLWHWPIFVFAGATHGSVGRFVVALAVAVVCSELCYRLVETPVRKGALRPVVAHRRPCPRRRCSPRRARPSPSSSAATRRSIRSTAPRAARTRPSWRRPAVGADRGRGRTAGSAALPRRVAIVGDSQGHSLAVNLPDGIDNTFVVSDGSLDGCSVYDSGNVRSSRAGFANSFAMCAGWQDEWAGAVRDCRRRHRPRRARRVGRLRPRDGRR